MLRTALRPYWLGLLALACVIAGLMTWAGFWQLGVAENSAQADAVKKAHAQPVVPIGQLLRPHQPFPAAAGSRKVTITGAYAAHGQTVVGPRRLDGRPGWWVVTPFVEKGTGVMMPQVRGFVADPSQATPPPQGTLTLTTGLAPGESPAEGTVESGRMGSVDLAKYVNAFEGEMYNAFGFVVSEKAASGQEVASGARLHRVPPPLPESGIRWRNAAYAVQWWAFAVFVLYMWWRMVRDAWKDEQAVQTGPGNPDGAAPAEATGTTASTQPAETAQTPATAAGATSALAHGTPQEDVR